MTRIELHTELSSAYPLNIVSAWNAIKRFYLDSVERKLPWKWCLTRVSYGWCLNIVGASFKHPIILPDKEGPLILSKSCWDVPEQQVSVKQNLPSLLTILDMEFTVDADGIARSTATDRHIQDLEDTMIDGTGVLEWAPVRPGTVVVSVDDLIAKDDGQGNIVPQGNVTGGTVDYEAGTFTVTGVRPTASYRADYYFVGQI